MNYPTAIGLLSGGLDSTVALAMTQKTHALKLALHFSYGQRASTSEATHAQQIADFLGVPLKILTLPWFDAFESALLGTSEIPSPNSGGLDDADTSKANAKAVWVPNRNGVFIEIAAAFAEQHGFSNIVVGFNREEATTFPDNSAAYLDAINLALTYSTSNQVQVMSPTVTLNKIEMVRIAKLLEIPFKFLWSCYYSAETMCGECESCQRLKRAMEANEIHVPGFFKN